MNLDQLRVFVAVAERLHVTQAAKHLNMTQSAASVAIASLEARYGVQLFHRIGRSIALTEAGREFLGEGRKLLEHAREVEGALIEVSDLRRGSLSLQASLTFANYRLPLIMLDFHRLYPAISLSMKVANTAEVAEAVLSGATDIGFVEGDVDDSVFEKIPVEGDQLSLVVAPSHPWAKAGRVTVEDLTSSSWVLREPGSGTRQVMMEGLSRHGLRVEDLDVVLELPSNEAVRTAVIAGAGAAALSSLVVQNAASAGRVVLIDFELPARQFVALRRADRHRSRAEDAFLKLAKPGGGAA